jgi:hypothetical protein
VREFPLEPDKQPSEAEVHVAGVLEREVFCQLGARKRQQLLQLLQLLLHTGLVHVEVGRLCDVQIGINK